VVLALGVGLRKCGEGQPEGLDGAGGRGLPTLGEKRHRGRREAPHQDGETYNNNNNKNRRSARRALARDERT
jgi:hypothetical protein